MCSECPSLSRDERAFDILLATAEAVDAEFIKRKDYGIGVVIIDTLIMAAGWKDEQSSSEVNGVIRILRALSNATDTFILLVDHTGKVWSRGARGSSDKEASTDIVLAIDDAGANLVVERTYLVSEGYIGQIAKAVIIASRG
jgi:RecA-family ATPase